MKYISTYFAEQSKVMQLLGHCSSKDGAKLRPPLPYRCNPCWGYA